MPVSQERRVAAARGGRAVPWRSSPRPRRAGPDRRRRGIWRLAAVVGLVGTAAAGCGGSSSSQINTFISSSNDRATHSVGHGIYVSSLSEWDSLPTNSRTALISALAAEERTLSPALMIHKLVHPLFAAPSARSANLSASRTATIGRAGTDPTYKFGYGGQYPFTAASPYTAAADTLIQRFIPCVSTDLAAGTLFVCTGVLGGANLYTSSDLRAGLAGASIAVQGYAAGGAGEDLIATLPEDVAAGAQVTITVTVFSVNVSDSCTFCVGIGASPSYVFADSPTGSFSPSDAQQAAGVLDTLSVGIPSISTLTTAANVAEAGYGALTTVLAGINNPSSFTPCSILTGSAFAEAVYGAASGRSIPAASCQEEDFTWSGTAPGGQLSFDVEPTAFVVEKGIGLDVDMSAFYGLVSATVTVSAAESSATPTATAPETPTPTGTPLPPTTKPLIIGQETVDNLSFASPQLIPTLSSQLGPPTIISSSVCAGQVPVQVAQWGDLSLVLSNNSHTVLGLEYNYGGWKASQAAADGGPPLPPAGVSMSPLVETSSGATVGDTVAQVQRLDPAAQIPPMGYGGIPAYLIDGSIFYLIPSSSTGLVSSINPGQKISGILETTDEISDCPMPSRNA